MSFSSVAERETIDTHLCPKFEKAVSLLGKRWTGLIIQVLMDKPRRFNDLHKIIEDVSDRVLTERLRELELEGLVERTVYPESPVRVLYSLTPKGRAMDTVLAAIGQWAEDWVKPEELSE